jgi:membrane protein
MPIFHQVYADIEELIFSNIIPTNSALVIEYINEFIISTDKLGKVGAIYVLIALIMFFKNYDYIVNDIFDMPSRKFIKAFKVYSMLLLVIPLVLGLFFYISSFLQGLLDKSTLTAFIHIFTFLPFLSTWMIFYITYQVSANTSIDVPAAIISSFIASLVWYLSKSAFVFYVVHNKTYESIYGNISTLLFFFLWIYISWVIFLHGLKFCNLLNKEEEIDHIA